MTYFVSMEDPALAIQPIHRLTHSQSPKPLEALQVLCDVQPAANLDAAIAWLQQQDGPGRFGYYAAGTFYHVTVKPEPLARWQHAPSVPAPIATLDVSLLHGLLLPTLGVDQELKYTADVQEAIRDIDHREFSAAWLLRSLPVSQVRQIAAQGYTLPPKSTFFYPKVWSGLALNPFD